MVRFYNYANFTEKIWGQIFTIGVNLSGCYFVFMSNLKIVVHS
jgi:hypothetical protein